MTMITRCDGCKVEITPREESVRVERDCDGVVYTHRMPNKDEPLHWCRDCALFAINALAGRSA